MFIFVVRQIRESKNISLNELSRRTGISRAYLFDLEYNRKFNPTFKILSSIANALEVSIKDLFYTKLDIEKLREEMHARIDMFGLDSKEVMEISQIIDLLINLKELPK